MTHQSYRFTVVACALSWLAVGLHAPGIHHQLTHHGLNARWAGLAATACLAVLGVVTLAALLRATPGGRPPIGPEAQG
jgi:hypothetical protein